MRSGTPVILTYPAPTTPVTGTRRPFGRAAGRRSTWGGELDAVGQLGPSPRRAGAGRHRRRAVRRGAHPGEHAGRREGVADARVDGRAREHHADDPAGAVEQRTSRVARL